MHGNEKEEEDFIDWFCEMIEAKRRADAINCYTLLKEWTKKHINIDSNQALYLGRGSGGLKGIPIKLRSIGKELEPRAQCVIHGVITALKGFKWNALNLLCNKKIV